MDEQKTIGAKELMLKRLHLFPREFVPHVNPHMPMEFMTVPSEWGDRALPKVNSIWRDILCRLAFALPPEDWQDVSAVLRQLVYDSANGGFYDQISQKKGANK